MLRYIASDILAILLYAYTIISGKGGCERVPSTKGESRKTSDLVPGVTETLHFERRYHWEAW